MGAEDMKMAILKNSRISRAIPLLLIMILFCPFTYGKVIKVDDDGQADFGNIQAGIDAANDGDTVQVAHGEYVITEPITFRGKAITVQSEAGRDETIIRMSPPRGSSGGSIATSYCTGTISGDKRIGGLAGRNWRNITASYNTATVTGSSNAGGIAADNYGSITNSYSTGAVNSYWDAAGLVGDNYGTIAMCYSTGTVSGNNKPGGLVSFNWPDTGIVSGFWDVETSGQSTSDGGTAMTTAEMQTVNTFLDTGWDFADETVNGTEDIWWILEGQDYPRLWWEASN